MAIAIGGSFIRGLTGFASKGKSHTWVWGDWNTRGRSLTMVNDPSGPSLPPPVKCPSSKPPDAIWEDVTSPEQALLYRLSGDYNPLHADPDIASTVGFDKPIIHGLCTYGHAARAVLLSFASGNPKALRSITVS